MADPHPGVPDQASFRAALLAVPPNCRDAWLNEVLGLGELPDDGPDLPRDCVAYIPCSVATLLQVVSQASVHASDVVVDMGSGLGRAAALVHLLTGATVIGIEIQRGLVEGARQLAERLRVSSVTFVEGDAAQLTSDLNRGSVFLLYCPFSGPRLVKVLADLEGIARTRPIRVCCVDLPLPPCPWLTPDPQLSPEFVIYRSGRSSGDVASGTGTLPATGARDSERPE